MRAMTAPWPVRRLGAARTVPAGTCSGPPRPGRPGNLGFDWNIHAEDVHTLAYVQGSHLPAHRRARRHRLLGRPRHLGRGRVDARQGRRPVHLHRRHRPVRRARHRLGARPRQRRTAPRSRAWSTAARRWSRRAWPRSTCGAFHIRSGGRAYFNTTPLGRAVTGHPAGPGDARGRRPDLGRRLDVQGQRHRAVLPLRPARQPPPAHLQALARRGLRVRARRPQGDVASGCSPTACPTATAPRRPTPPTPTSGAPPTRPRPWSTSTPASRPSSRSWACGSGTRRSRSPPRT